MKQLEIFSILYYCLTEVKVINSNISASCGEMCSKLPVKTPKRR